MEAGKENHRMSFSSHRDLLLGDVLGDQQCTRSADDHAVDLFKELEFDEGPPGTSPNWV